MSAEGKPVTARKSRVGRFVMWGFAAIGVAAALSVIYLASLVLSMGMRGDRSEPAQVAGKAPSEQYNVQSVDDVRGTDLVQIEIGLGSPGRNPYSSSDGGGTDQRNLILLDRRTGANRRLLPDNRRSILRSWLFPAVAESPAEDIETRAEVVDGTKEPPPPPYAYYALAVRQPKGQLIDLLVGDFAGGNQAFVLHGIDGIDKIWMLTPTRVAVLMREKLRLHYRVIDIPTLKVVTARAVDIG